ncbi:MAG: phosphocholine cytidylyltransferase family protein [Rhodospirillales bacterium]|nr:phosphocholine cytidylyltransferase family protein [Rhodospirillales bacterium]
MQTYIDRMTGEQTEWEGLGTRVAGAAVVGPMQAIILAAGESGRLDRTLGGKPKCLAKVGGKSLIRHQLETLRTIGIREITVVVGYGADAVREEAGEGVNYIINDLWEETDSLYSLSLCSDWVGKPVIVLNSTVLAHPEIIRRVAACPESSFAYDSAAINGADQVKVELKDDALCAMSRDMMPRRIHGEDVGILRFDGEVVRELFKVTESILKSGGRKEWMSAAIDKLAQCVSIWGIEVSDLPWIEVSTPEDLAYARNWIEPMILTSLEGTEADGAIGQAHAVGL